MERVIHKATSHEEARRWDIEQHVSMTIEERLRVARELKRRAYPRDAEDVRACHRPVPAGPSSRAARRPRDPNRIDLINEIEGVDAIRAGAKAMAART